MSELMRLIYGLGNWLISLLHALNIHPQLEELDVSHIYPELGINDCTALSTLLRHTITNLQRLILDCNCINDEGLGIIVNGLSHGSMLKDLFIVGHDQYITSNGWKSLATLLETPSCMIESIEMESNDVGDNGALAFANALTNNSTLKKLDMTECGITEEGWTPFSKLLCDTSSVNNTYLSNHTLQCLGDERGIFNFIPTNIISNLVLNRRNRTKQQIAMIKILQNHSHFDMEPFFEWEFKVLPITVSWFAKASACTTFLYDEKINKMKLSAVYDFIKEFPMLYIEPMTRKEIADCTALEEELQGGEHKVARLEEVQCCKTRVMRRNQARLEEVRQLKARAMRRIGMK